MSLRSAGCFMRERFKIFSRAMSLMPLSYGTFTCTFILKSVLRRVHSLFQSDLEAATDMTRKT